MKLASIPRPFCATALLGMAQATSALAQEAHQHTETTPPAAASSATPTSPSVPSRMMQAMPTEMMQVMQKMHSGAMPRKAMMGASVMSPGGAIQKCRWSYRRSQGRTQNHRRPTEPMGAVR
jgi:hypothetical protein